MIIANLIKKYVILLFVFLLIEEVLYYTNFHKELGDTDFTQGLIRTVSIFLPNLIIGIFAIGDLRKFKSRFYLIPLIILLNKVVGTCILLVYLLYLKQQQNEKEVNTVSSLP